MDAAVTAVVAFIEGPTVGGSRDWPLETILEILGNTRNSFGSGLRCQQCRRFC